MDLSFFCHVLVGTLGILYFMEALATETPAVFSYNENGLFQGKSTPPVEGIPLFYIPHLI